MSMAQPSATPCPSPQSSDLGQRRSVKWNHPPHTAQPMFHLGGGSTDLHPYGTGRSVYDYGLPPPCYYGSSVLAENALVVMRTANTDFKAQSMILVLLTSLQFEGAVWTLHLTSGLELGDVVPDVRYRALSQSIDDLKFQEKRERGGKETCSHSLIRQWMAQIPRPALR